MISSPQSQKITTQLDIGSFIVNKKYKIIQKIHQGMSSNIFLGIFKKNNKDTIRAIKVQYNSSALNSFVNANLSKKGVNFGIRNQVNVIKGLFLNQYGKLDIKYGLPHMYQYGCQNHYNYIVMNLYGPNLSQLMKLCGGKFSARTTLLVALQILDRLEQVHKKKYLYSGICPQNFLIGLNKQSYLIYMTDFSKSTVYKSKSKNVHIPYQQTNIYQSPIFDNLFLSINSQLGIQMSRRDDIQSFMYLILFLYKGRLPWSIYQNNNAIAKMGGSFMNTGDEKKQNDKSINGSNNILNYANINAFIQQKNKKILDIKRKISPESLFKSISFELIDLMSYVRTLSFYQKPDYSYIRKKLWSALSQTDYEQLRNNIIVYDWNQRESLDYQIYRDTPKFSLKQQNNIDETNSNQKESLNKQIDGDKGINSIRSNRQAKSLRSSGHSNQKKNNNHRTSMGLQISKKSSLNQSLNNSDTKKRPQNNNSLSKFYGNEHNRSSQQLINKSKKDAIVELQQKDEANIQDQSQQYGKQEEKQSKENKNNFLIEQKIKIIKSMDEQQMQNSFYNKKNNLKSNQVIKKNFKNERKNSCGSQSQNLL